ncbi:MAG TPA: diaminopimelate epimerase [Solirubrobacteraceae bacterium]|jgi:diaminopimelate epimerase|nr:diaminopimelate epimerase [Solirubrobacteraceae bacterium]
MKFEKWQALGNDYVILERAELPFPLTPERVRALCAPHTGIGADGVLLLSPPAEAANVADLRIFNPDGSEAELSGNGARQAVLYLRRRGWTDRDEFTIHTDAGTIRPTITGPFSATLELGSARLTSSDFPSGPPDGAVEVRGWHGRHVAIGNPQCAIAVDNEDVLADLDLAAEGRPIESSPLFPHRTNVSWYAERSPGARACIRARIFERGVGETLSSGTGASGAAVAYVVRARQLGGDNAPVHVTVVLDGGELEVEVGSDLDVRLTGWAVPVFEGSLSADFVDQLREMQGGAGATSRVPGAEQREAAR